jgi:pimeloyl-ACP methyl ester carboxylesterase
LKNNHLKTNVNPVRGEFIDLSGERIYYYAAGSRGGGEPIVLIHGFPTSSHLWLDVVAKLPPGHRIVVLDLLGFGRSDAPPDADYTIGGHGERLVRLLDALRIDRAMIVGHGTGGAIALWAGLTIPERVSRIAMIGSSTSEGWFSRKRRSRALYDLVLRMPPSIWMPIIRGAIARSYSDPERGKRSAELYLTPFTEGQGARVLRKHLADLDPAAIASIRDRAAQIRIPLFSSPPSPWRFMPEENPSEAADVITRALSS